MSIWVVAGSILASSREALTQVSRYININKKLCSHRLISALSPRHFRLRRS